MSHTFAYNSITCMTCILKGGLSIPALRLSPEYRTLVPRHENGDAHLDDKVDLKQTWKAVRVPNQLLGPHVVRMEFVSLFLHWFVSNDYTPVCGWVLPKRGHACTTPRSSAVLLPILV